MAVRGDSPKERRGPAPANPNFLLCALVLPSSSGECDDGRENVHDIDPNARKEAEPTGCHANTVDGFSETRGP